MNTEKEELLRGNKIEILEMLLKCIDCQLILSWKICVENKLFQMTFFNVSRFRISETSAPFEIHASKSSTIRKAVGKKILYMKFVILKRIVSAFFANGLNWMAIKSRAIVASYPQTKF